METARNHCGIGILVLAGLLWTAPVQGQNTSAFSEIDYLTQQTGLGIRSLGMGGTGVATARDFSAVALNPAGIAFNNRSTFELGMTSLRANTEADFLGNQSSGKQSFTRFHSLGGVFPVPVYQGALSLAAGFGRVHDFNSVLFYEGFNDNIDDQVYQQEDVSEEGALNMLALAGAMEVAPNVSVGLALNFWFGDHQYNSIFEEFDDDNLYTFDNSVENQYIDSDIYGFDAKLGVQYRANPHLQFGATIGFPRTLWIEENYADNSEFYYDDDLDIDPEYSQSDGFFKYRLRMPFAFGLGSALRFGGLTLSGDLEYIDWSQTRYLTDTPISDLSRGSANLDITRTIQGSLARRLGAEYVVQPGEIALRAGYRATPSPYQDTTDEEIRRAYTLGAGIPLGDSARFDISYQHGWWKQSTVGSVVDVPIHEDRTEDKVFFSLGFNF